MTTTIAANIEPKQEAVPASTEANDITATDNNSSISAFLESTIDSLCSPKVCASISEKANFMSFIPNFYAIVHPLVEDEIREEEQVHESIAESRTVPKEGSDDNETLEKSAKETSTNSEPALTSVTEKAPVVASAVKDTPATVPVAEEVPVTVSVVKEATNTISSTQTAPTDVPVKNKAPAATPVGDVSTPESPVKKAPSLKNIEGVSVSVVAAKEAVVKKIEKDSVANTAQDTTLPTTPMKSSDIKDTQMAVTTVEKISTPPTAKEVTTPAVAVEKIPVDVPTKEDAAESDPVIEKVLPAALATEEASVPLPLTE